MESAIIETLRCPLDPDLFKSWEKFNLECPNSYTSSKHSELAAKDIDFNYDSLIDQLKTLSCEDDLDSKYVSPKSLKESIEIKTQKKDHSKGPIFLEDKELGQHQSSSLSLKNKELLNFTVEADVESVSSKLSNQNCEINSQKKNNTKKLDNTEIKNESSKFQFENNKLLKNICKSSSNASAEDESDSDNEEPEETVTLRERYPNRHNRSENNRQQRTVPFPQNHSKTIQQHLFSNNSNRSTNCHSTWNNAYASHDGYKYLNQNNSTYSDTSYRTVPSYILNSEYMTNGSFESFASKTSTDYIVNGVNPCAVTGEIVRGVTPCDVTDQIVNGVIPCEIADQIVNDISSWDMTDQMVNRVIPCALSDKILNDVIPYKNPDQIVNGVIACSVVDEVLDSVVPAACDNGNVHDNFSAGINNVSYFDNMAVKVFPESIGKGYAISDEDRFLDSHFENLTAEKVEDFIKHLTKLKSDTFLIQNPMDLIKENSAVIPSEEFSQPTSNLNNFGTEFDGLHSSLPNTNVEQNTCNSNLHTKVSILGKSGEFYSNDCSPNKSGIYSNMVSKNFTSINSKCLSPEASEYNNISEEIETFISRKHDIVQWEEMKEWVMKEPKNVSERSTHVTETSWNELPFVDLDSNNFSKCLNTSEYELPDKKKSSKSKQINRAPKSIYKFELPKISRIWGTANRDILFHSAEFCIREFELEREKTGHQIKTGEFGTEKKKVIHFLRKNRKTKYKGTNLHYAIRSGNKEKVFCIVEMHKECHGTINEINLRDNENKTVLDYAKKNEGMELLTKYLEENGAKEYSSCLVGPALTGRRTRQQPKDTHNKKSKPQKATSKTKSKARSTTKQIIGIR